ncbi:uncharacterized protein LOC144143371 [Haemaphysalis longicornis]
MRRRQRFARGVTVGPPHAFRRLSHQQPGPTAKPQMADTGPSARFQGELQSRLNKVHEGRDIIGNLLKKWMEKADAVASHAASVGGDGRFVGAFMDGCATLDGMFTRLFHVYALLSEEENFADPELPGVAHGAIPRRSAHSVLEAPQDDSGSRLVLPTPRLSKFPATVSSSAPPPVKGPGNQPSVQQRSL